MKNKAVILIATRPDSKRFPNKVFKMINGLPAIEHLLSRLEKSPFQIYLCVPYHCYDYEHLKAKYPVKIFYGNGASPLHRMADCLKRENIKTPYVVRVTHDDILIDLKTVIDLLKKCISRPNVGYAITPGIVEGAGVEIIHRDNLLQAATDRKEPTEFVSYFVKNKPKSVILKMNPRSSISRTYRLTMDYYEDYVLLETIFRTLGNRVTLDNIVDLLDKNPYLLKINRLPTISVYTCAYNAYPFIYKTVSSLLQNEQNVDFEYVFVDDGSKDKTLNEILRFSNDPRMKILVNEGNFGLASSSNIALNNCRGNYVMRLDADDLIVKDALNIMLQKMIFDHSGVVYSSYININEKDDTISSSLDPRLYHHAGCALMDKRLINEIRFKDGLRHFDSLDLYKRIQEKVKISYIYNPLWYYRQHKKSLSHSNSEERKQTLKNIRRGGTYA